MAILYESREAPTSERCLGLYLKVSLSRPELSNQTESNLKEVVYLNQSSLNGRVETVSASERNIIVLTVAERNTLEILKIYFRLLGE
jgi:hypothetical protein